MVDDRRWTIPFLLTFLRGSVTTNCLRLLLIINSNLSRNRGQKRIDICQPIFAHLKKNSLKKEKKEKEKHKEKARHLIKFRSTHLLK